jgi:hypothetical protein
MRIILLIYLSLHIPLSIEFQILHPLMALFPLRYSQGVIQSGTAGFGQTGKAGTDYVHRISPQEPFLCFLRKPGKNHPSELLTRIPHRQITSVNDPI